MPYKSPYPLLTYFGDSNLAPGPEDLKRLQQKFIAEFNLPGNQVLEIGGQSFTKDDILKCIEELKLLPQDLLHQKIAGHKNILLFLVNPGSAGPYNELAEFSRQLLNTPETGEWQKQLCAALSFHFSVNITRQQFINCSNSIMLLLYLSDIQRKEVYDEIRKSLQAYQNGLLVKIQGPQISPLSLGKAMAEFNFIQAQNFPAFLNSLPADFSELRSGITKNLASYYLSHIKIRFRTREFLINNTQALLTIEGLAPGTIERLNYLKKETETFSSEKTGNPGGLSGGSGGNPLHGLLFRYINLINQVYTYLTKVKTNKTKTNRFFYFLRIFAFIMLVLNCIVLLNMIVIDNLTWSRSKGYIIGALIYTLIMLFVPRQGKTKREKTG